jgi:hypothetical protein
MFQWILHRPAQLKQPGSEVEEEILAEADREGESEEKEQVSGNVFQNLSSLLFTLQRSLLNSNGVKKLSLADGWQSVLSESGKELMKKALKKVQCPKSIGGGESLRSSESGSLSGFIIHLPDRLLDLLVASLSL